PEPVGLGRLVRWGLVASVVLLALSALVGGFGVLAFGALAALWALAIAWIIVFGPPAVDGHALRARGEHTLRNGGRTARTSLRAVGAKGDALRRDLAGRAAARRTGRGDERTARAEPAVQPPEGGQVPGA
ncbi:hypothetical protein, partial [Frankia canadensis]|uniref:hypothetical protein n=1 Tax=Frankia canadensis TaxID=1836972 RepID=UPI003C2E6D35